MSRSLRKDANTHTGATGLPACLPRRNAQPRQRTTNNQPKPAQQQKKHLDSLSLDSLSPGVHVTRAYIHTRYDMISYLDRAVIATREQPSGALREAPDGARVIRQSSLRRPRLRIPYLRQDESVFVRMNSEYIYVYLPPSFRRKRILYPKTTQLQAHGMAKGVLTQREAPIHPAKGRGFHGSAVRSSSELALPPKPIVFLASAD